MKRMERAQDEEEDEMNVKVKQDTG